jgi:predicted DsbA family dithiol-disulfide isomerase
VRIEKLKQNFNIEVKLIHFPLHPETPAEGQTLEALFAGRDVDIKANYETMKARMEAEGLTYGLRTHTYNSRLAQELAKWADGQPGSEGLDDALYHAYFIDNHNIGDLEVLVGIAASLGLDADDARAALEERRFKDAVDEDWAKSQSMGVTGVPTFVAGGYGVVGAQPYEAIAHMLKEIGAEER